MLIDVKQADMVDATLVHWRGTLVWLGLGAAASLIVAGLEQVLMPGDSNRWAMFVFFAGALAILIAAFRFFYIPRRARAIHRQLAQRPYTLTYDDDFVAWKGDSNSGGYPWNAFVKWREGQRVFLLYRNRTRFQIIPKAAFENAAAVEAFRALLKGKIDKKA